MTYLGPNFAILKEPIRLRDLAKNNDVEFSIRMKQLNRTKLLWEVVVNFSGLFWSRNMENLALKDLFCTHQVKRTSFFRFISSFFDETSA